MSEREYHDALLHYKTAILHAKMMLSRSIITPEEYAIIDTNLRRKYGIFSCSIFVENDLIINEYRGNIPLTEEVK